MKKSLYLIVLYFNRLNLAENCELDSVGLVSST